MSNINLDKIGWQNGTLVSKAKVEINGVIYEVEPEEYSGSTPLSAENLMQMEDNAEDAINKVQENLEEFLKVIEITMDLGIFSANSDKYNQEYTIPSTDIPEGYIPIGIVGYCPIGTYYSHVAFTKLFVSNRTIQWSAKNTRSGETGEITCIVYVLCKNIG